MITSLRAFGYVALAGSFATAAHGQVYLNDANISVALGASMAPEPFANQTTATSLANIIDAPTAASPEDHTQPAHVWVSGGPLELDFDFGVEYDLLELHFWNYFGEGFDVDNIDFTFFDANNSLVGTLLGVAPALGGGGSNPIFAENYALAFPGKVQFVNAVLTGTNGEVDFNNLGFTGELSCMTQAEASSFGAGWPGTSGVPSLSVSALPLIGSTVDLQIGNKSGAPAPSCLLVGFGMTSMPSLFGGTVLVEVDGMVSLGDVPPAGMSEPWTIANDSALCGMELYTQLIQLDAGASDGVAFSAGLRLVIGN